MQIFENTFDVSTHLAVITTGEGIVIGCAIIGLVLLYSQTADRWSWGAPFRWPKRLFRWLARRFNRAQRGNPPQTSSTEGKGLLAKWKRCSKGPLVNWMRRSITVLIAVGVIFGIVSFIRHKKGHFRYVNLDDLIEAGTEGHELWGWVEKDQRGPYAGWVQEWGWNAQGRYRGTSYSYLKAKYFVKAGKKDGKYESWSKEGTKIREGRFEDGYKVGGWSFWHENGQKSMVAQYGNGGGIDSAIAWKPNGAQCPETRVVNGNGTIVFYHANGEKRQENAILGGRRTGPHAMWHDNGEKSEEGAYTEDGEASGLWTFWNESGKKSSSGYYVDGKKSGSWTSWYDNGEKWDEGVFKNGKKEGEWLLWRKDGTLVRKYNNKDGKEIEE